jgi:hypothetical protein
MPSLHCIFISCFFAAVHIFFAHESTLISVPDAQWPESLKYQNAGGTIWTPHPLPVLDSGVYSISFKPGMTSYIGTSKYMRVCLVACSPDFQQVLAWHYSPAIIISSTSKPAKWAEEIQSEVQLLNAEQPNGFGSDTCLVPPSRLVYGSASEQVQSCVPIAESSWISTEARPTILLPNGTLGTIRSGQASLSQAGTQLMLREERRLRVLKQQLAAARADLNMTTPCYELDAVPKQPSEIMFSTNSSSPARAEPPQKKAKVDSSSKSSSASKNVAKTNGSNGSNGSSNAVAAAVAAAAAAAVSANASGGGNALVANAPGMSSSGNSIASIVSNILASNMKRDSPATPSASAGSPPLGTLPGTSAAASFRAPSLSREMSGDSNPRSLSYLAMMMPRFSSSSTTLIPPAAGSNLSPSLLSPTLSAPLASPSPSVNNRAPL